MVRYPVSTLSLAQLIAAASDPETAPLPDIVATADTGTATVAWRDPSEPIRLRAAGARVLIERFVKSLDHLYNHGFLTFSQNERRRTTLALRENPEGVAKLLEEVGGRTTLAEVLRRSLPGAAASPPDWRDAHVWALRALAHLTRLGFPWNPRRRCIECPQGLLPALTEMAPEKLLTLGQPIAIINTTHDSATFLAVEHPGNVGPPLHAHEAVDQLEVIVEGGVRFRLGQSSADLAAGAWLPVKRRQHHTFSTTSGAVIASVVNGPGTGLLLEFFRNFNGTPALTSLRGPSRAALRDAVFGAFARHGILAADG